MLVNLKNRMLSTGIEYYQEIWNIQNKKKQNKTKKIFQNIVVILKIDSIDFIYFFFICRASRICSCSLLILCAIIVIFSTRILYIYIYIYIYIYLSPNASTEIECDTRPIFKQILQV